MHQRFRDQNAVLAEIVNMLQEHRIAAGYDPVSYEIGSPVHTPGTTHDTAEDANIILALESRFGIDLGDDPQLLDRLVTVGRLAEYVYRKLNEYYGRPI